MHIIFAGVHFNLCAFGLSKLAHWGPAHSQPPSLIQDNPMKYTSVKRFRTVTFLKNKLLLEDLHGRDHDYCPWFTNMSGSMRCPAPGRSIKLEMWS